MAQRFWYLYRQRIMKNLTLACVLGGVLAVLVIGRNAHAQIPPVFVGGVYVGMSGAQCGAVNDSRRFLNPTVSAAQGERWRDETINEIKYWEVGFVDGVLAARHLRSMESTTMVDARFESFCVGAARRDVTMMEVGLQVVGDMKTASLP